MPKKPADEWYNILSMDGGGIRGIVTATVIQHMEAYGYEYALSQKYIEPRSPLKKINMSELFDLMAGTSTGSLLTTALVMPDATGTGNKFTSDDVLEIYYKDGGEVFLKYHLPAAWEIFWGVALAFALGALGLWIGHNKYTDRN